MFLSNIDFTNFPEVGYLFFLRFSGQNFSIWIWPFVKVFVLPGIFLRGFVFSTLKLNISHSSTHTKQDNLKMLFELFWLFLFFRHWKTYLDKYFKNHSFPYSIQCPLSKNKRLKKEAKKNPFCYSETDSIQAITGREDMVSYLS